MRESIVRPCEVGLVRPLVATSFSTTTTLMSDITLSVGGDVHLRVLDGNWTHTASVADVKHAVGRD